MDPLKPAPFVYVRPANLDDCLRTLAEADEDAKVIAGGQSLIPLMNFRLARPSSLIDIGRLSELRGVSTGSDGLTIGALTTHFDIETHPLAQVGQRYGLLSDAARLIAHLPIRTRGTLGGSVAHADPSAEWPLVVRLFDAEIHTRSLEGGRVIAASDFFEGFFTTGLHANEVLTHVRIPKPPACAAIVELARRKGDFAVVAVAVAFDIEDDRCTNARIALSGVADVPVRAAAAETLLSQQPLSTSLISKVAAAARDEIHPAGDVHGSQEYRKHLAEVLVGRALTKAWNSRVDE